MSNHFEILNSITESMAVINLAGEILFTNKAWNAFSAQNMGDASCTGINNNYLHICETVEGEESKMATDAKYGIQQVIDKEVEVFELEYPCHSPTENRWFILRASNILTNPDLTLVAHINMTNRKNAELEIEKNYNMSLIINDRLHTTLYKIVHDIQNPLSGIIGLIDLSKSESDINTLNEYLELIEEGSNNLSLFVKATLKHISTSEESQTVDVHHMLSDYLSSIKQLIVSNAIDVRLDIQQPGEFHTNVIEFRSILSNLISNAIKYSDERKSKKFIVVKFSSNQHRGILKVEDNGVGITEEDLSKVTQRNYQVKQQSKSGVGLGLYMVEKSVINLGGSIKINSDFGMGSEFIVDIPNRL